MARDREREVKIIGAWATVFQILCFAAIVTNINTIFVTIISTTIVTIINTIIVTIMNTTTSFASFCFNLSNSLVWVTRKNGRRRFFLGHIGSKD